MRIRLTLLLCLIPALAVARPGAQRGDREKPVDPNAVPESQDGDGIEILDSPFEDLELQCIEQGDGQACFDAATAWRTGEGIEKPDRMQAENLYRAGCSFNHVPACMAAADMYLKLEAGMQLLMPKGTVSLDMGQAAWFLRSACELGELSACGLWGDLLVDPRSLLPSPEAVARGVETDLLLARQAYADGCNQGSFEATLPLPDEGLVEADLRSCARLSTLYAQGIGVRRDRRRQSYFLSRACNIAGGERYCEEAEAMELELQAEPEEVSERPVAEPKYDPDDTQRFIEDERRIKSTDPLDRPLRVEFELGAGGRWTYAMATRPAVAGMTLRLGLNLWYHLFGVSIESGVITDDPLRSDIRTYSRFGQTVSFKFAMPLPIKWPIAAKSWLVLGVGPTLNALKLEPAPFQFSWGAREMLQFVLSSAQETGPRQWGAIRIEQQQSWWVGSGGPEHSTQVVALFGFTTGGWGPEWRKFGKRTRSSYTGTGVKKIRPE